MTFHTIDESQHKAARVVGYTYLLAMITAIFGFYVRAHLIVSGNAAETARNIIAQEQLFRLGIASDLMTFVIDIILITVLYVILNPVHRNFALLATFWRLMETAILIVVTLNGFDVLRVLNGAEYLGVFEANQVQALARLSLGAYGTGYNVGFIFLGLGSTVFSFLWLKSNYIPKSLAILGIFSSLLLAICNFAFIIFPSFTKMIGPVYMAPMGVFEVTMGFWLIFKAMKGHGKDYSG